MVGLLDFFFPKGKLAILPIRIGIRPPLVSRCKDLGGPYPSAGVSMMLAGAHKDSINEQVKREAHSTLRPPTLPATEWVCSTVAVPGASSSKPEILSCHGTPGCMLCTFPHYKERQHVWLYTYAARSVVGPEPQWNGGNGYDTT